MPGALAALLTAAFALACGAFVWQPTLASFADDSVSYLVMAQVFSPWQAAAAPVAESFAREAFYPPLFPLVLALTGAGHDMALAHAVTALLLAACLPLVYLLGCRWLANRWAALAATAMVALLPAMWIEAKGVLSEPLFCLSLLATLYLIDREGRARPWMLALALAALAMTRTVGLVVAAAYAAWALLHWSVPLRQRLRDAAPALAPVAAYAAWVLLRPAATADINAGFVAEYAQRFDLSGFAASLLRQARSMAEAWTGSLLIFWVEGRPARVALAGMVGALSLAGLALRIAAGRPDAWIVLAYLATFLVWPFYDQMQRFIFPALPVLVLYAFGAVDRALRSLERPVALGYGLLVLLMISLTLPALAFIRQRATVDTPQALITDWYRTPDLDRARSRAQVHLDLMQDMEVIRQLTGADDRVMWVAPSYIALLAERRATASPDANMGPQRFREQVLAAKVEYLFLSAFHPRDTIRDTAWRTGLEAMKEHGEPVHTRISLARGPSAVLLRMDAYKPVLLKVKGRAP